MVPSKWFGWDLDTDRTKENVCEGKSFEENRKQMCWLNGSFSRQKNR